MICTEIKQELIKYRECYSTATETVENIKKHLSTRKLESWDPPKKSRNYIYYEDDLKGKGGNTKLVVTLLMVVGFLIATVYLNMPTVSNQIDVAQMRLQFKSAMGILTILLPVLGFLGLVVYSNRLRN